MKKLISLLLMLCCFSAFEISAQTKSSNEVQLDSITMKRLRDIENILYSAKPRYKMYQTENIHILLKLDTVTGKIWMVQYALSDTKAVSVPIDNTSLLGDWDDYEHGRFELYPTKNMYNYILLDTKWGYTYQVQWSFEENKRFRILIY